jgi:hypothetical protein
MTGKELRATSYELRATSYEPYELRALRATSYELRATSYELRASTRDSGTRDSPLAASRG